MCFAVGPGEFSSVSQGFQFAAPSINRYGEGTKGWSLIKVQQEVTPRRLPSKIRMGGFINLSIIGIIIKAGAEEESLLFRSTFLLRLAITDSLLTTQPMMKRRRTDDGGRM